MKNYRSQIGSITLIQAALALLIGLVVFVGATEIVKTTKEAQKTQYENLTKDQIDYTAPVE